MSKKLLIGVGIVLLVTIIILAFMAFDGNNERVMGKLAMECLNSGSNGPACDLYFAHVIVQEANEALIEAQSVYDTLMAPIMEPTADLPP